MNTHTQLNTFQRKRAALLLAAAFLSSGVQAAPTLPQVAAGQATFNQQGNVFSITNTPGTIINWQSFNIGAGEITRFIQQNGNSAVLNRVLGQDPTKILGALQSNGKVFLINPNGIVFGQGSRVDVNGLVASSLNLSDSDFRAGRLNFQAGANVSPGAVRNDGAITTPSGGQVFLIAPHVENTGIITSPQGDVILAAGHSVQLVDSGDPDLQVVLAAPADQAINLGRIIGAGGRIGIFGALVNQRGVVNADSAAVGANGKIVLKASGTTTLAAGSTTSAKGGATADGGTVEVLGAAVAVDGGAQIDASGKNGGTVLVGGEWQGGGATLRAQQTTFAAGASIRADGSTGNGGKVVVWSDGATAAHGAISAQSTGGGQGGNVETSGHALDIDGIAVNAAGAKNGTWLLDPYDIEVVSGGTASALDVRTAGAGVTDGVSRVAPSTLTAAGTDIVLQAQHDLTVTDAVNATGNVLAQAGHDITVNAQVASSTGSLDFRAGNAFTLGANGILKTGNDIAVQANTMTFAGNIAGANGQLPILSLSSTDAARTIAVQGSANETALVLDPQALSRLSATLYEINIGNSQHTGSVEIDGALTAASNLVLNNAGSITVNGAVDLSANANSAFVAQMYGANGGTIALSNSVKASKSVLLEGDSLALTSTIAVTNGGVTLRPNNAGTSISIGGSGSGNSGGLVLNQAALAGISASSLTIGGLPGAGGGIAVTGAVALSGSGAPAKVTLDAGYGALSIAAPLTVPGALTLNAAGIGGAGVLQANSLTLRSTAGIGSTATPLNTRTATLAVRNTSAGNQPIVVANVGALTLQQAVQDNTGAIAIDNVGALTVPAYVAGVSGDVRSVGGDIGLTAHDNLTIAGHVATTGGTLRLVAANNGAFTTTTGSRVASTNGEINVTAGTTSIAANTLSVSDPAKLHLPADPVTTQPTTPATPPTLDICLATRTLAGCDAVLAAAQQTCATNPAAPHCTELALTYDICAATPSLSGCSAIITQHDAINACLATPTTAACVAALPAYDVCVTSPSTFGCAPALAQHDAIAQCLLTPTSAACAATLPTYAVCAAAPATFGCAPALAQHDAVAQCLLTPTSAACAATLPTYAVCAAAPTTFGCAPALAQHDAIAQCLLTPTTAACAAALPTYAVCAAAPTTFGCAPALAQHDAVTACIANPSAAACQGTLPLLAVCQQDAGVYGCAPVLSAAAFNACVADPYGVGCGAVLPTATTCAANPSAAGCDVVTHAAAQCLTHPDDAACAVAGGVAGGTSTAQAAPLKQAQQSAVQLINTVAPAGAGAPPGQSEPGGAAAAEKKTGPATASTTGAKNDKPAAKTYCN